MSADEAVLADQAAYYSARASEYDEWFLRRGRYDRGAQANARWFDAFWQLVADALAPGGRIFFVDNRASGSSERTSPGEGRETRTLNDGRTFEIVKIFYEPEALEARLAELGFRFEIRQTGRHFLFGAGGLS